MKAVSPESALLLVAVVVLQLYHVFGGATTASKPYPDFQHLNITQIITDIKLQPPSLNSNESMHQTASQFQINLDPDHSHVSRHDNKLKLKLKLIHRDQLSVAAAASVSNSAHHTHYQHRLKQRMKRDVTRVSALVHRLTANATTNYSNYKVEDLCGFGSDVVSGMDQGSGEYFVRIGVGSPPRSQYMVVDSGSDIVWVQCQPCAQCYRQSDPVFDPSKSASFAGVSCSSAVCDQLQIENAGCRAGHCRYQVLYGDGSYTKGTLALETLTFGGTAIRNVAIGCGHRNQGMFVGAAGLLGLGGGSMSFVGQLGGQSGGAFTYCLVSRGTESSGSLEFGLGALPVGAAWVPLLRSPHAPSFYYVGLEGLGVGGMRVPIPQDIFRLTESGQGGVVMDTGTAVTRLPTAAYVAFRDVFLSQTASLPRSPGVSIFDTCYNLDEFMSVRVPTVSFYFAGGPILTLPARNFLIPVDEGGTFCFAFAPSGSGLSIIGNIQQEGIQISVNGANGFVGFGPNVC